MARQQPRDAATISVRPSRARFGPNFTRIVPWQISPTLDLVSTAAGVHRATVAGLERIGQSTSGGVAIKTAGLLFYLTGSSQTVSEALENLARYSRATNEALVVEISQQKDEVILAIRHLEEFDEPHRQFFEALA